MTVWVVEEFIDTYSANTQIRGVFSTREKADAYITNTVLKDKEKLFDFFDISELIVDQEY